MLFLFLNVCFGRVKSLIACTCTWFSKSQCVVVDIMALWLVSGLVSSFIISTKPSNCLIQGEYTDNETALQMTRVRVKNFAWRTA